MVKRIHVWLKIVSHWLNYLILGYHFSFEITCKISSSLLLRNELSLLLRNCTLSFEKVWPGSTILCWSNLIVKVKLWSTLLHLTNLTAKVWPGSTLLVLSILIVKVWLWSSVLHLSHALHRNTSFGILKRRRVCIRAVESDFKKSNKSRMPESF